mgnify:CR=1 FL=1
MIERFPRISLIAPSGQSLKDRELLLYLDFGPGGARYRWVRSIEDGEIQIEYSMETDLMGWPSWKLLDKEEKSLSINKTLAALLYKFYFEKFPGGDGIIS